MDFEFNKINQLNILTGFCVKDEQECCPSCGSKVYSSLYLEKCSSKSPQSYTITLDSEGPQSVFYMKCECEHLWLEKATPSHKRWRIKGFFMKSFGTKE